MKRLDKIRTVLIIGATVGSVSLVSVLQFTDPTVSQEPEHDVGSLIDQAVACLEETHDLLDDYEEDVSEALEAQWLGSPAVATSWEDCADVDNDNASSEASATRQRIKLMRLTLTHANQRIEDGEALALQANIALENQATQLVAAANPDWLKTAARICALSISILSFLAVVYCAVRRVSIPTVLAEIAIASFTFLLGTAA